MLSKKLNYLYPWLVWSLAAVFFFYKYLIQVSPGVMSIQLMHDFSLTGAGLGNLAACFFYAYLLMQVPAGILLDNFNPRLIITLATFICAAGTLLFAHAETLFLAQTSRFIIGLSAAFAAVSCFKLATLWFPPKRFAFIAGLSMTAAMLGAIFGEAPLSYLVHHVGWRGALEIIAVPCFGLSIIMLLVIRNKTPLQPTHENTNILPMKTQLGIILKNKQTWFLSLFSGLAFSPISVFGGLWGVSFLQKAYALTPIAAANATSLLFIGFAIGCPLTGLLSDKIERRKTIMVGGTLVGFFSLACVIYLPLSILTLQIMLFLFGLGASCFFLCFSMIREIHSLAVAATVLGFMNTFDSVCEALTEPLVGKFLDISWTGTLYNGVREFTADNYRLGLTTLIVYLGLALILLPFIRETYGGLAYPLADDQDAEAKFS